MPLAQPKDIRQSKPIQVRYAIQKPVQWQTWHSCSDLQKDEEGVPLHQQCGTRVLILP